MEWNDLPKEIKDFRASLESIFKTTIEDPRFVVVQDRSSFEEATGLTQTPRWMVSFAKKGLIIIFSQESIEKETIHTANEWNNLLKHELVHLFYMKRFDTIHPLWLNEGLAAFFSGTTRRTVDVGFEDVLELTSPEGFLHARDPYVRAYSLVKKLLGDG